MVDVRSQYPYVCRRAVLNAIFRGGSGFSTLARIVSRVGNPWVAFKIYSMMALLLTCITINGYANDFKTVWDARDSGEIDCPKGFSTAPNSTICTADSLVAHQAIEDGYILGDTLAEQGNIGYLPGTPGEIVVNPGSTNGISDWNLLDQPGFSDYDCDSFFPTEWGYAFANNDVDVAQATFIDDGEYLDGLKFYAGSHGHNVTFIGACVGGGLYPNWDCNRVDLRIERKVNGVWNHVDTFHLAGETQDLNGGGGEVHVCFRHSRILPRSAKKGRWLFRFSTCRDWCGL